MNLPLIFLVFGITAVFSASTIARVPKTITVSGEYYFGPDISQAEACRRAEDRAKEVALRKANGEALFSESLIDCDEKRGDDCRYSRTTISHLNGLLLALEEKRTQVWDQAPMRVCRVSGVARVDSQAVSARLFFRASLNRTVFRTGDEVVLTLELPVRSYLAVFSHTDPTSGKFTRIYPNRHEKGVAVEGKVSLPTPGSGYRLVASAKKPTSQTEGLPPDRQFIHRSTLSEAGSGQTEYLYLITTEERVHWLEQYSALELQAHLSLISPEQRFTRVLAYRILQ